MQSKYCPRCGFRPSVDAMHWRVCVPRKDWPEWMRLPYTPPVPAPRELAHPLSPVLKETKRHQAGIRRAEIASEQALIQSGRERTRLIRAVHTELFPCTCGVVTLTISGLHRHQRMAKVHIRERAAATLVAEVSNA